MKKVTNHEYLSVALLFCFSFYFTFIDFQNILSILTCFLFFIFFLGIFVLGPIRDKNEYLKLNFELFSIEYMVGKSTKIKKFIINDKTELYCQLDKYEVTGKPLDTYYSSSFYQKDENDKYNLFLQCNNKHKKQCETFTKAVIRYLTTISPIENIEIIDKT